MLQKRWVFRNQDYKKDEIIKTAQSLSVSPVILTLLYNRGITSPQDMRAFIAKSMQNIHNPLELPDMEAASNRIYSAIQNGEKICIYGDYDVDGITSVTILYKYLLSHGADVSYYIPDRFSEGYGLNIMAVNKISKTGCRLLITVDCGITSVGEVQLARAQGMDVIITDHHNCRERLPEAVAVVDAKREDSVYPFRELCGAGVALKTVLAVSQLFGESAKDVFYKYCHYAAIGTIADIVTLTDENRTIVDRGIKAIKENAPCGIAALIKAAGISDLNSGSVAFGIAPRLNAAGRMESAQIGVELLMCSDKKRAQELANLLNEKNTLRKYEENKIYESAVSKIEADSEYKNKKIIVICGDGWHEGVIGIAASRICEKYHKPVIMLSSDGKRAKGSARSVDGFNIYDAISSCGDLLDAYGGHSMAAGVTVKPDNLEAFDYRINSYADENITDEARLPSLKIDCRISPSALTAANIKMLSSLEPFGCGNEEPVFSIHGATVKTAMQLGDTKAHLRLQLEKQGKALSCIAFRMGELYEELTPGRVIDIAFSPEINVYNGFESVQLRILDIKLVN